jgi:hypothetical protein
MNRNTERFSWNRRDPDREKNIPKNFEDVIVLLQSRLNVHREWLEWFQNGNPSEVEVASAAGVGCEESQQYYIAQYEAAIRILVSLKTRI